MSETTRVQVRSAPAGAIYVGRPKSRVPAHLVQRTEFGNPFPIGVETPGRRQEVISQYFHHVITTPTLLRNLPELRGKSLACWCAPGQDCHVDVLIRLLGSFTDEEFATLAADMAAAEYAAAWDPTKAAFQRTVEQTARALGWELIYHTLNSRGSAGGFPDLIMIRGRVMIARELKSRRGRIRPEQLAWIDALQQVPGVIAGVVRPDDWDRMLAVLETGTLTTAGTEDIR